MTNDNTPTADAQPPSPTEPAADSLHGEPLPHVVADATVMEPPAAEPDHPPEAAEPTAEKTSPPVEEAAAGAKKARKPRKAKAAAAEAAGKSPEAGTAAATTPAAAAATTPAAAAATTPAAAAATAPAEGAADSKKKWYVVKVTSGREDTIKAAVERKVKIEGLEEFFGQIAIPVEELVQKRSVRVTDKKTGEKVTQEKKVIKYQKKFPGYIFAEVEFNDRILYLFRETSGVGDFVGASLNREPTPMTDREVRAMLSGIAEGELPSQKQKVKLDYEKGDKVKIRDGAFANMEGIVKSITETKDTGETPKVKVEVTIFGRPVEVDLDYWHVDKA